MAEVRSSTSVSSLIFGSLGALVAFFCMQGYDIGLARFVTPLHHDDFFAFTNGPFFDALRPRPVSSNFIYMLGHYGPAFYFFVYSALCSLALALTAMVPFCVLRMRMPSAMACSALAFAVCCAWLAMVQSVYTFQYIGLSTNLISYVLGLAAALYLFGERKEPYQTAWFSLLVLLAALAKEDMAFFLCAAVTLKFIRDLEDGATPKIALKSFCIKQALVVGCFTISLIHSKLAGSAFTGGVGPYDLSDPAGNFLRNARLFWESSPSFRLAVVVHLTIATLLLGSVIFLQSWTSLANFVFALLPFTTAAPYLLLPRFSEYYGLSFVPLMVASWGPLLLSLASIRSFVVILALSLAMPVCAAWTFLPLDAQLMGWSMGWYNNQRDVSRRQIEAIVEQSGRGLKNCEVVSVEGLELGLGVFANSTSSYANRLAEKPLEWRVVAPVTTSLGGFLASLRLEDRRSSDKGRPFTRVDTQAQGREGSQCAFIFEQNGSAVFFPLIPTSSRQ